MNSSSLKSIIKLGLVVFVLYAAFKYNGPRIHNLVSDIKSFFVELTPEQTTQSQDHTENKKVEISTSQKKITSKKKYTYEHDDQEQNIFANTLNQVFSEAMNNSKFAYIVEKAIDNSIKNQAKLIEKDPAFGRIIIEDLERGEGDTAKCGDVVKVMYNIYSLKDYENNPELFKNKKIEKIIQIGNNKNHQGTENVIIGMSKKGTRKGVFFNDLRRNTASEITSANKSDILIAHIELKEILKKQKNSNLTVHASRNMSAGSLAPLCGHKISFNYNIKNLKGKIIYPSQNKTKIATLQIGHTLPLEVNKALLNTPVKNVSMTIIATPQEIISHFPKGAISIPQQVINKNEVVILNFTRPN